MITDEQKVFLENLFVGFTKALFAMHEIPNGHMVVHNGRAEVIPDGGGRHNIPDTLMPSVISAYANAVEADFILHISESWAIEAKNGKIPDVAPSKHPDRIELLALMVGEPSGSLSMISGKIKRTSDNTPYVQDWDWTENITNPSKLVLPFDD